MPNYIAPVRLKKVTLLRDRIDDPSGFPFNIPVIANLESIEIKSRLCFFVGENGSGKSTLLEAIADKCEFGIAGGSRNLAHLMSDPEHSQATRRLSRALRLSWSQKLTKGFFLRAESYFDLASRLEALDNEPGDISPPILSSYGGSPHEKSHGESFLALFENRFFSRGIYLLDEPEAALSPQRQLSLLLTLNRLLNKSRDCQFLIATHSPLLLAYPGAQILSFDGSMLTEVSYRETQPYQIVSGFLSNPDLYIRHLFGELDFVE